MKNPNREQHLLNCEAVVKRICEIVWDGDERVITIQDDWGRLRAAGQ